MKKIAFVVDPVHTFNPKKDTTIAMMRAAKKLGFIIWVITLQDLYVQNGDACANAQQIKVTDIDENWYSLEGEKETQLLSEFTVILMRKDPPVDMHFLYAVQILNLAQKQGVKIINSPEGLLAANEKLFILQFPQCITETLVSSSVQEMNHFIHQHNDVVIKPLDGMGGVSIFRIQSGDLNKNVILETMTENGTKLAMLQKFIPEITGGDKRILLINGDPVPYVYARKPSKGEFRANLAAGGYGEGMSLTSHDRWLCEQVKPRLLELGLSFVGLDVIGDYISEINVTSPTCVRELDTLFNLDIGLQLLKNL